MSLRALLFGLLFVVIIAYVLPYCDLLIRGAWFGLTAFPIASFLVLIGLALVINPALKAARCGLRPPELAVIFSMSLVAAGIPSFGLTALLMPYLVGPSYYMAADTHFLQYLPAWATPRDPLTAEWFYEALPDDARLPWGDWLVPLLAWSALIVGVYLVFFGLVALLRKQWMEHERLTFPLAELAIETLRADPTDSRLWPALFCHKGFWWCFGVGFLLHGLNGLHHYYPSFPGINIYLISLDPLLTEHPWNALRPFWVRIPLSIVAIAFFLPQDISLSLWVFYFFFLAQQIIGARGGWPMPQVQAYPVKAFIAHQMFGAILVSGLHLFWNARHHFRQALRDALRRPASPPDPQEMLSSREAILATFLGFCLVCAWGMLAGAGLWTTAILFGLYFLTHTVAVRLVCEGGMLYVQHPFRPLNLMLAAVGSQGCGKPRLPMLVLFDHLLMVDNRSPLMPTLMLAQPLAGPAGLPRRHLAPALALAVVAAAATSFYSYLRVMYSYGGLLVDPWFSTYYARDLYARWTELLVTQGQQPSPRALAQMASGAVGFYLLMRLYLHVPGWRLHPIGFLMGASWPMINFWFPICLAWIIKSIAMKAGGIQLCRRLGPWFLGLIVAEFLAAALWAIIAYATGTEAHKVFAI